MGSPWSWSVQNDETTNDETKMQYQYGPWEVPWSWSVQGTLPGITNDDIKVHYHYGPRDVSWPWSVQGTLPGTTNDDIKVHYHYGPRDVPWPWSVQGILPSARSNSFTSCNMQQIISKLKLHLLLDGIQVLKINCVPEMMMVTVALHQP
jgi:hypothetical protein